MNGARYLPIVDSRGKWINHPGLFVLARMAVPDDEDEAVFQAYKLMSESDNSKPEMNTLENMIRENFVGKNVRPRVLAGSVILELARLENAIGAKASLSKAYQLVAHNQQRHDGMRSQIPSLVVSAKEGLRLYRSTSHLQAALVYGRPSILEVEDNLESMLAFFGVARWFEDLLDRVLVPKDAAKWHLWRIPKSIPSVCPKALCNAILTAEEQSFCNIKLARNSQD